MSLKGAVYMCARCSVNKCENDEMYCKICDLEVKSRLHNTMSRTKKRSIEETDAVHLVETAKAAAYVIDISLTQQSNDEYSTVIDLVNTQTEEDDAEPVVDKCANDAICLICEMSMVTMTDVEKERHLNDCLDRYETDCIEEILTQNGVYNISPEDYMQQSKLKECDSDRGLRLQHFFCVLCDIDLSKRSILNRCLHLKKCAKELGVSTKDLLLRLGPDVDEALQEGSDDDDDDVVVVSDQGNNEENVQVTTASAVAEPKRSAWDVLMSNAKTVFKNAPTKASTTQSKNVKVDKNKRGNGRNKAVNPRVGNYAPAYKQVKVGNMTKPIIVDGFHYASSQLSDCYFLTHFHYDHYCGLDSSFDCGSIYCSQTTAGLLKLKLKVDGSRIIPLEMNRKYTICIGECHIDVTLLPANHCPGAACILFKFPDGKLVLHTGDFRWDPDVMLLSPTYRQLVSNAATNEKQMTVYLDTTYCDAAYTFPKQNESIRNILNIVQAELQKEPPFNKPLLVFGAYGIGKEKVYMSVAEMLQKKVWVDKTRWKTIMCYDWDINDKAMVTTDKSATNIHVVSMNQINFNNFYNIRNKNGFAFSHVVGFSPTGWTHKSSGLIVPRTKDGNVIYDVPYSEHSSFNELKDFIKRMRPRYVIPTVKPADTKAQLDLLYERSAASAGKSEFF